MLPGLSYLDNKAISRVKPQLLTLHIIRGLVSIVALIVRAAS